MNKSSARGTPATSAGAVNAGFVVDAEG